MGDGRKIVIATFGSLGDLNPYVALAHALKRIGFRPVLAASAFYRDWIESEGLGFAAVRPDVGELAERFGMDIGVLAERVARDDGFMFRELIFPYLRQSFEDVAAASEGAAAVVAHSLCFSAKLAAERLGLPLFDGVVSPLFLLSAYDPPLGPRSRFVAAPRSGPALAYNKAMAFALTHVLAWQGRPIARLRRELGLPRRRGRALLTGGPHAAATFGLVSPLLAPPQPDHPADLFIVGHTFHDRFTDTAEGLPAALEAFLEAGGPPIVVTLGSFVVRGRSEFYRAVGLAALRLRHRAVLLVADEEREALAEGLPPQLFVAGHVRHSLILPRAAAVVHHGGSGACGQALRAGRPQLVVPVFGDQGDNAARVERLGVGRLLPYDRCSTERLVEELGALFSDDGYARSAREAAGRIGSEDGAAAAAAKIAAFVGCAAISVEA
ncbi:glycosyltransferase [Methylosinus sp. H3A]|uniref:glycosyltransferase n=1 Tax=Methylosinus sp. H3A TaxID=2785786 RepID=UPI0018C2E385|nr:nucleotide disphospho-sugar-binding domain-containing protein [Methylosinus sp. H3A]MBG0811360.1 glycosyltransferase [Methylosinus sp. H3A]